MRFPFRAARYVVGIGASVVLMAVAAAPAHADPHALFYTTIGQQQLFFNVLAALDQADYVEPAEGTRSRDEIVQKRNTAGFIVKETEPVLETKTDLASILTRGITLEGNDLWTTYLSHQLALEVARRTNTDEVVRIYCELGLGLPNCSDDYKAEGVNGGEPPTQPAYVNGDPRRPAEVAQGAAAALDSDSTPGSYDQREREKLLDPKNENVRPRPRSESIAALTQNIQGNTSKELARDRLKAGAMSAYRPATLDPTIFNDIAINQNTGKVTLESLDEESGQGYIARYTDKLAALVGLPGEFMDVATQGANEIISFQAIEEDRGALAKSNVLVAQRPDDGVYTTATGKIEVPALAIASATEEAINALANTEQNLQYAPSLAESEFGQQPLGLENRDSTSAIPGVAGISDPAAGNVAGTTSGRVAQAQNTNDNTKETDSKVIHDAVKDPLPLNINPIGVHHEAGFEALLTAIGYQAKSGGCGCTEGTDEVGKKYGKGILQRING